MSKRFVKLALAVWLPSACAPVEPGDPAGSRVAERGTLDFVTLNIWHDQQDWPARLELIVAGLRAATPDVICLQEVLQNEGLPNQAETLGGRLGYTVHFESWDTAGSVKRYGNAILTRAPLLERGHRRLDPASDYRVVLHARVAAAGDTLDVYCTHLHHTEEGGAIRRTQVVDALEYIDETRGDGPIILAGDFNAPATAPELAPVRDRFGDAYGAVHADTAGEVTTLNTARGHRFARIDHVFYRSGADAELVPRRADVVLDAPSPDGVWPSDHFGVLVHFALLEEPAKRRARPVR
ncbi:MAG TPA: endonuclease/exonuclease/phosphatase family protein [Longimicrobiales bacterium]|nr:endonuclease/exonuclease/phosphatase family protein [Longimicrobiales bacterium]